MTADDRHRFQRLSDFASVQDAHLARFRDHFLTDGSLTTRIAHDGVRFFGRLRFIHDLVLDVDIQLAVDATERVRPARYTFHAGFDHDRHRPIFRYDNAHAYPGHPDAHHKHLFDPLDPDALGAVEWIGAEREPSLGEVMDELFAWWFATGRFLGLGEG